MQIKLKQIVESEEALTELVQTKFPVKVSFKIKRLADKVQPELKTYLEKHLEIFKEFGEYDAEKDTYTIPHEKRPETQPKFDELLDVDINIEFEKIKIEELGDSVLEPKYLLNWIFE